MKKDKIRIYFLELILVAILAFALFVPNFSRIVLAIGLAIAAVIIRFMLRKRNIPSINKNGVIIILTILAIIYLVAFYLMRFIFWLL